MRRLFWVLGLLMAVAEPALAWGHKGHVLVATVAEAGLNAHARQQVAHLLGRRMADVATWADDLRGWQRQLADPQHRDDPPPAELQNDPVARAFVLDARNARQPNWHFTNLPLGATRYRAGMTGTQPDDVVQTIRRCIGILAGHASPGENITAPQALRLLIHFVGDLHQPLHAGCGFWLAGPGGSVVLATPAAAGSAISDLGGNSLKFGPGREENLHAFWDNELVDLAQGSQSLAVYTRSLASLVGIGPGHPAALTGDPMEWSVKWAGESARLAAQAYGRVDAGGLGIGPNRRLTGMIRLAPDYAEGFLPTVTRQLARGGYRLAAILNAIWP